MCLQEFHDKLIPVLVLILALLIQACAGLKPLPTLPAEQADCERLFQEMDQRVAESGVADAGSARIADFPELRVDRFLASFAKENLTTEAYAAWLERLRRLDETARMIEWRNLPPKAKYRLQAQLGANVGEAVKACGHILFEQDLIYPHRRSGLLAEVEPPDAYSTWQRIFGLYFLSRWAIVEGVWRVQREMREPFIKPGQDQPVIGRLIRYTPPGSEILAADEVAKILQHSADNPLGIPEPSEDQLGRLFSAFAPAWTVDAANDGDRIGTARIAADGKATIDTDQASVYRLVSHTRFGGRVLLQLNYMVWFPARLPEAGVDIYSGRFDGLIWRVTLGMDGKPLAYDSIHSCGCYYQIFPGEGHRVVQPQDGSEPILSPMPILGLKPGERLMVSLASRTHFIRGIESEALEPDSKIHGWLDYDELRSLPLPGGTHRSLFDTEGLIPGSERPERFLLWPMGVPSAGAMRQWGTHAIAFLGKRHFDEPRLMEKLLRPLWE
jgi:hypothetical protein